MTRRRQVDELPLRRDALIARANLQRVELRLTLQQLTDGTGSARRLGGFALQSVRWLTAWRGSGAPAVAARPWMLSAAWLLVRALRRHPSVRWLAFAAATGTAVWWIARALKAPDVADDDSG
jgi:hypothetical protein